MKSLVPNDPRIFNRPGNTRPISEFFDGVANTSYRPDLEGKPVTLQYKPTERSRKWRNGYYRPAYSVIAHEDAQALALQESWHTWRYVEGIQT